MQRTTEILANPEWLQELYNWVWFKGLQGAASHTSPREVTKGMQGSSTTQKPWNPGTQVRKLHFFCLLEKLVENAAPRLTVCHKTPSRLIIQLWKLLLLLCVKMHLRLSMFYLCDRLSKREVALVQSLAVIDRACQTPVKWHRAWEKWTWK